MPSILGSITLMIVSLLINPEQVAKKIHVGAPEDYVKAYLLELSPQYQYATRKGPWYVSEVYPWLPDDIGYYSVSVHNGINNWWHIHVGINDMHQVTQVLTFLSNSQPLPRIKSL